MSDNRPLRIGVLIIGSSMRIRYGRLSTGRNNTYTMVFSGMAGEGQAKIVCCGHEVVTPTDIDLEANELWAAERNVKPDGAIASDWGCVALLCKPASNLPTPITNAWTARVRA